MSCRALRHITTTWSRPGGRRLHALAGTMGHSSVTTTDVDAKIVAKIAEHPARFLDELVGPS